MKDIKKNTSLKLLSFFLSALTLFIFVASAVCTAVMLYVDVYTNDRDEIEKDVLETVAFEYAWRIGNFSSDTIEIKDGKIAINEVIRKSNNEFLTREFPEVYFTVKLKDGTILLSNYNGEDIHFTAECSDRVYIHNERTGHDENGIYYDTAKDTESESLGEAGMSTYRDGIYEDTDAPYETVYVDIITEVFVPHTFESPFGKLAFTKLCVEKGYELRFVCPTVCIVSLFVFIFLFVVLMWSAGSSKGKKREDIPVIHRLPFDVITAFIVLLGGLEVVFAGEGFPYLHVALMLIVGAILIFIDSLIIMFYFYSFAVRCNTKTLFRYTLIGMVIRFIIRCIKKIVRALASLISGLPLIWKTVLAVGVVCTSELFVLFLWWLWKAELGWLCFWWFIGKSLLIPVVFYLAIQLKKLKQGGREILSGELTYRIDTRGMPSELREHGETLNGIGDRIALAVEEKLKSERLKTELITNVSHDIKTPLTSIINYVDLLKKEEFENERIGEYVDVLDRQSARLKKLVNDLVEASKAATGNLSVELSRLDAGLLVSQVLGEYEERLSAAGLTTVFTKPNEPLYVLGDGSLMWRVFDNLMSNICKYAQSGTRVYVSVERSDGHAVITLKNISAYPLNISEDELMERFVRGDSSRSTEGSGLGLSIANSLCTLQNAKLTISVDGDLFKAKVEVLGENFL